MQNRDLDRGRVSRSEPAPAIDVERLVKRSQYFGVPGEQLVVQRIAANQLARSPGLRGAKAEESHVVNRGYAKRVVGVKAGLSVSDGITGARAHVLTRVAHVIEQRALNVLRAR